MEQTLRSVLLAALLSLFVICGHSQAQLRVVSWNTAGGPREGLGDILEAIGNEDVNGIAKPIDILSLQEQSSVATTTQLIVDELNTIYGPGTYARSVTDGATSGAGRPGLIYNTTTVELVSESAFGFVSTSNQARQTLRYEVLPIGYDTPVYVYSNHYKASTGATNEARRLVEAEAVRNNADALGQGTNIIYTGDLNMRSSSEQAYQELLSEGNGQAFDPVNAAGTWHDNATFKPWHTQAPSTIPPGSLIGGGVDDRFDFQLVTDELLDNQGYSYIPGSYRVFGNNGTHSLNGDISSGSGASPAILNTLEAVSDHLPVVADYQVPAILSWSNANTIPFRVVRDSEIELGMTIFNSADVVSANGADVLTYDLLATGDLSGSVSGMDLALGAGNDHFFPLDTSSVGLKNGAVEIDATSQHSLDPAFDIGASVFVVEATGDFDGDTDIDGLDFLAWQQNVGVGSYLFEGDADGSRVVDGADLAIWQSQHGTIAALVAVPEPSTSLLIGVALCAAAIVRRPFS